MDYIKEPEVLQYNSETLVDLPNRLINVVVLRSALQAGMQVMRENSAHYNELYERELRKNLW